jgi:serine/threonine-protein kinase SRPK3
MPQNILMGTPRIDKMFRETPSERLAPRVTGAPGVAVPSMSKDFRLSSEKFSSGYEDLQAATDISVRLADFGLSTFPYLHMVPLSDGYSPCTDVSNFLIARFNDKSPSEMPSSVVRIPEVVLNTPWNHKVDIWKLGLLVSQPLPLSICSFLVFLSGLWC